MTTLARVDVFIIVASFNVFLNFITYRTLFQYKRRTSPEELVKLFVSRICLDLIFRSTLSTCWENCLKNQIAERAVFWRNLAM